MGKKYKVIFDLIGCIGAYTCVAVDPKDWEIDNRAGKEGKANLIGSEENKKTRTFEKIIDESELQANIDAARVCPVNVIHIIDLETGKKII